MSEDAALTPEAIENRRRLASEQKLREVEQAEREALKSGGEAAKILRRQEEQLAIQPRGRPPETVPTRRVPVEQLEKKEPVGQVAGIKEFFRQRGQKKPKAERRERVIRETRRTRIASSRGTAVFNKRNPFESSGRISTELNPSKADRLVHLREQIRAFRNRQELHNLEKIWRRTRAQRSHDPELRP